MICRNKTIRNIRKRSWEWKKKTREKNFTKCKRQNGIIKKKVRTERERAIYAISQCKDRNRVNGEEKWVREGSNSNNNGKKSKAKEANYKHTETKELNYKTSSVQKNIETWKNPNGNVITATPNSQALWFVLLLSLQLLPFFSFFFSSHIFDKAYQASFVSLDFESKRENL